MGLFSNNVKRERLVAGDHIYVWRNFLIYAHHGIFVGGNRVIHFTNDEGSSVSTASSSRSSGSGRSCKACARIDRAHTAGHGRQVICSCLDCFLAGHKLRRFEYGVSVDRALLKRGGCCSTLPEDENGTVVRRATYLLQHDGFPRYDLDSNNCEDFARYCKTGYLRLESGGMNGQMNGLKAALGFIGKTIVAPFSQHGGQAIKRARERFVEVKLVGDNLENLVQVEVEKLVRDAARISSYNE